MKTEDAIKCGNNAIRKYPEFLRFLKENGVYMEWLKNRADFLKSTRETKEWRFNYDSSPTKVEREELLTQFYSSFSWTSSKQGYIYWKKLNDKYRIFLRKYGNTRNPANGR